MTAKDIPQVSKRVRVTVGGETYEWVVDIPANAAPNVDVHVSSPLRGEPLWEPGDVFVHRSNRSNKLYSYVVQWVDGRPNPRGNGLTSWRTSGEFGLGRATVTADWYNHTLFIVGLSGGLHVPKGYQCCVIGCTTDHYPPEAPGFFLSKFDDPRSDTTVKET